MRSQPLVELGLRGQHAFVGSEPEEMCLAHIGDVAVIRPADLDELGNVVGMVCAHLHHGHFRVRGHGEQCERHAYVVVEVALGGSDLELRTQCGGDKFLGGGFPVCAGQSDYRNPQGLAVMHGQRLQRLERIFNRNDSAIRDGQRARQCPARGTLSGHCPSACLPGHHSGGSCPVAVDYGIGRAGLEGLQSIIVPVEILSPESKKHGSRRNCAAVGTHLIPAVAV